MSGPTSSEAGHEFGNDRGECGAGVTVVAEEISGHRGCRGCAAGGGGCWSALWTGYRGALQTRISHETDPGNLELYYPWQVALDYARLGDKDKAFLWLEKCYADRAGLYDLKVEPALDSLHSDPRFADLVRRIGFPQYAAMESLSY
jgi:hypothetical protein